MLISFEEARGRKRGRKKRRKRALKESAYYCTIPAKSTLLFLFPR